ncbi:basic blue protein-like [Camellia sinensis]|uniref:basic blue protein-like n=1 Tax=Camellia sinensis TaxID=4442 RepID=UPI00103651C6|nr:basic blue protein-like [Camellia sinensis]
MAVKHVFIIVVVIFPIIVSATDFIVGDEKGWTVNFDYQAWVRGKDFRVGDKLVFLYPEEAHNVFKVNGTGFQNCNAPPLKEALTSGKDTVVLSTPGHK